MGILKKIGNVLCKVLTKDGCDYVIGFGATYGVYMIANLLLTPKKGTIELDSNFIGKGRYDIHNGDNYPKVLEEVNKK